MYMKDPINRVTYTFRIEEELLNDIKAYAKATNNKLPKTFNDLLKKSIDGMTVNNTWLKDTITQFITIPTINELTKYPMDLQNEDYTGTQYEVKSLTNNLDIWDNTDGYMARTRDNTIIHHGIELLLKPDIINTIDINNPKDFTKCLLAIYCKMDNNKRYSFELIDLEDALQRLNQVNPELYSIYSTNVQLVKTTIKKLIAGEGIIDKKEITLDKKELIISHLETLAKTINTGNIVPIGFKKKEKRIKWDNGQVIFGTIGTPTDIKSQKELLDKYSELEIKLNESNEKYEKLLKYLIAYISKDMDEKEILKQIALISETD